MIAKTIVLGVCLLALGADAGFLGGIRQRIENTVSAAADKMTSLTLKPFVQDNDDLINFGQEETPKKPGPVINNEKPYRIRDLIATTTTRPRIDIDKYWKGTSTSTPSTITTEVLQETSTLAEIQTPETSTVAEIAITEAPLESSTIPTVQEATTEQIEKVESDTEVLQETSTPAEIQTPETSTVAEIANTEAALESSTTPTVQEATTEQIEKVESETIQPKKPLDIKAKNVEKSKLSGKLVPKGQYPFVAGIAYKEGPICGGVIVSQQYVFSAAQCFQGKNASEMVVFVGNAPLSQAVPVEKVDIHECYNAESKIHDVALVKLQTPLEYNEAVAKVTLPKLKHSAESIENGTILGLDATEDLVYENVQVLGLEECSNYHSVISSQLCVTQGPGNCVFAAGLPFVQSIDGNSVLAGIGSYFSADCTKSPTVLTRINKYGKWIAAKVKGDNLKTVCWEPKSAKLRAGA